VDWARSRLCQTDGMSESVPRGGSPDAAAHDARTRGVADRERGRLRLNRVTAAVGVASLAATGAVALALPGPVSASTQPTGTQPTTGGQGTSNSSQGDQGTSGLTPPATAPSYVPAGGNDGGAVSTSGGTHS
jgi:hypothetical protein